MLILSLLALGITSLMGQIVITRELMVSFYGNEFFIGWIFFGWLIWTAVGCLMPRFFFQEKSRTVLLLICHLAGALLFLLEIFLVRLSKSFLGLAPGQVPDLMAALFFSLIILAPLCLILGMQFSLSCDYWKKPGTAYFWEAIGFVIAGVVFNYFLVSLNEFQIIAFVWWVNIIPAVIIGRNSLRCVTASEAKQSFFYGTVLFVSLFLFFYAASLNLMASSLRYPKEKLLETTNSIYGKLDVTQTKGQYNFYHNGLATGTSNDQAFNECLIHFPMLSYPNPRKILFIDAGFNGALSEILKYAPTEVYYAQINPDLLRLSERYTPNASLKDPRVHLFQGDPRRYFKIMPHDFDVMIVNLPNPSTAMINRYFSDDFFKEARRHLKADGIFSTHLTFAPEYVSIPLEDLGASIYKTLQRSFSSLIILPEDNLFFLASNRAIVHDPKILIERMQVRGVRPYFLTARYMNFRYSTDRIQKITQAFESNKSDINLDLKPKAYYYNLTYWLSVFHQGIAGLIRLAGNINYNVLLGIGLCLLAFVVVLLRPQNLLMTAMSVGGFSLMSAQMLIIYVFQVFYGNLYYKIASIICVVMLGLALGALMGKRARTRNPAMIGGLHLLMAVYFLVWLFFFKALWWLVALTIGIFVGFEFTYLVFLGQALYAADLMGSCIGSLLTGVFFLPVFGVSKTLLLLGGMNAVMAAGLFSRTFRKI
ncbi:MAG: hypothetical protein HQL13_05115 [Candidatus Omnitrophica bacterium]|nr:hypothetical protein [Candidatus Omnitrophota bacterium]